MKRFLLAVGLLLAATAYAQNTATAGWQLTGPDGAAIGAPHRTQTECDTAARGRTISAVTVYTCPRQFRVTPPAVPACTAPQPPAETRTQACPAGTTGSWLQTRSYTAAPAPACWTASEWLPTAAPAGACVAPPVEPPPPPVTDPVASAYPLYPALNLNDVPWHTAAGGWGVQLPLQAPSLPVTTRQVSVSSVSAFNAAAAVPGTRITITSGWAGNTVATVTASDIDVVIPQGVAVGAIEIGGWPRTTPIAKVRIRGGGRMGQFRATPVTAGIYTDVVIDGIDLNGDSPFGGGETNQAFRADVTRMAVLNSRVIAAGYTWLGATKHVVIANSNFYHGGATRADTGYVEAWGIRNTGGPMTIVDSRIQGTRYHNIRAQSVGGTGELLYIARSTLVGAAEGRTAWLWNNLNNGPWFGQGAIVEGNSIYTYAAPGCGFGADISSANVTWSRVANNRFFGGGTAVISSVTANGGGTEGNTFAPLTGLPAWGGPGDPRQVPLPNGAAVIAGEGACPGF